MKWYLVIAEEFVAGSMPSGFSHPSIVFGSLQYCMS
jgi:hypothetical protein